MAIEAGYRTAYHRSWGPAEVATGGEPAEDTWKGKSTETAHPEAFAAWPSKPSMEVHRERMQLALTQSILRRAREDVWTDENGRLHSGHPPQPPSKASTEAHRERMRRVFTKSILRQAGQDVWTDENGRLRSGHPPKPAGVERSPVGQAGADVGRPRPGRTDTNRRPCFERSSARAVSSIYFSIISKETVKSVITHGLAHYAFKKLSRRFVSGLKMVACNIIYQFFVLSNFWK